VEAEVVEGGRVGVDEGEEGRATMAGSGGGGGSRLGLAGAVYYRERGTVMKWWGQRARSKRVIGSLRHCYSASASLTAASNVNAAGYTLPIAHCRLQMADSILTGPEHVAVCILPDLTHGWVGLDWTLACGRACL
jgi:hypothetical protein